VKNFLMHDADGREVFVIYKSSWDTCIVMALPPITPLGIAIMMTS
jgi:hypothetical protein